MQKNITVERHKVYVVLFTAIAYVCWLFFYMFCESYSEIPSLTITIVSILGTLTVIVYEVIWWRIVGKILTPINIFSILCCF